MRSTSEDYKASGRLLDGRSLAIRAVHPQDKDYLLDVWKHLSPTSIYHRFFSPKKELTDKELRYYTEVDFRTHVALLALVEEDGKEKPVGVGRFIADDEQTRQAEVALTVEDDYQGLGIGSLLLQHLVQIARERGYEQFNAFVLCENGKMLEVFEHSTLPMEKKLLDFSTWEVALDLTSTS